MENKQEDGCYPAHYHNKRDSVFDNLRAKFSSNKKHWIDYFNIPYLRIEDGGHKEYLNYFGITVEEKDGKLGLSLLQLHIIVLYRNLETLLGKESTQRLSEISGLLYKWLEFHKTIKQEPIPQFEFYLWVSYHFETSCYIYADSLDFDTIIQSNSNRFLGQYNDEPHILISLTNQWSVIFDEEHKVHKPNFYLLSEQEAEILLRISESKNQDGISVKTTIKKSKLYGIEIERKATKEELKSINKTGQKLYFGEIKDLQYQHGKAVSAIITGKIRFDKTNYLRIK